MNLTSRSRYALKIMIEMGLRDDSELVRRQDIVQRQGVPEKYLDQIMIRLRKGGLVKSVRGRLGGYSIGRAAEKISLWDIFHAVEDSIYPVMCLDEQDAPCFFQKTCATSDPWHMIFNAMRKPLATISLAKVIKQVKPRLEPLPSGVQECPPGRAGAFDNETPGHH